jgi:sugar lactone lactonase YvrE
MLHRRLSVLLLLALNCWAVGVAQDGKGMGDPGTATAGGVSWDAVEVVAGGGDVGDGGKATNSVLAGVGGMVVDGEGNLYLADIGHNRVRRVDARTGVIQTVAGTGNIHTSAGKKMASQQAVFTPVALALDQAGQSLDIVEIVGARVLRVNLKTGEMTDLGAPVSGFGQPVGIKRDSQSLLVVDTLRGQVWEYTRAGWSPTFPDGAGFPPGVRSVVRDKEGNLYASEFFGYRILRWERRTGRITPYVGTGRPGRAAEGTLAHEAAIGTPDGLALDAEGNLYFSDMGNKRVCKVDARTGRLHVLHSSEPGATGLNWTPGSLALDDKGNIWVGDASQNRVLLFARGQPTPRVVAGGGDIGDGRQSTQSRLAHPGRVAVDRHGNLYISDAMHHRVRKVEAATGLIRTVAGTGEPGYNGDYIHALKAQLNYPGGVLVNRDDQLFIADYYNNRVRMVDLKNNMIVTVAGNGMPGDKGDGGPGMDAMLLNPHALAFNAGGELLITSAVTPSIRALNLKTGIIKSVSLDPRLVPPQTTVIFYGIASREDEVFLADGMRSSILHISKGASSSVLPASAGLRYPMDVAISPRGELYICDTRNNRVVRWDGQKVEVVLEGLGRPRGIALDAQENLYIADTFNNRVLRVSLRKGMAK